MAMTCIYGVTFCTHVRKGTRDCTIQYPLFCVTIYEVVRKDIGLHTLTSMLPWYMLPWSMLPWSMLPWSMLPWSEFQLPIDT